MSEHTNERSKESDNPSSGGLVEKATSIVPEIAHDLVARALPGFIILSTSFRIAPGKESLNPILSAAGWTVTAYAVGLIADFATLLVGIVLEPRFYRRGSAPTGTKEETKVTRLDQLAGARRRLGLKLVAETVVMRILSVYAVVLFVYSWIADKATAAGGSESVWSNIIQGWKKLMPHFEPYMQGFGGTLILAVGMWISYVTVSRRVDERLKRLLQLQNEEKNSPQPTDSHSSTPQSTAAPFMPVPALTTAAHPATPQTNPTPQGPPDSKPKNTQPRKK